MTCADRSMTDVDLVITDLAQRTTFLYLLMDTTESLVLEEDVTFFLQNPFRARALEEKLRDILRRR